MARRPPLPRPSTGVVRQPKGVAQGVGVQYVGGKPSSFVRVNRPTRSSRVGLAPGWGVRYEAGRPVGFVKPGGGAPGPTPAPAAPAPPPTPAPAPVDPTYLRTVEGLAAQRGLGQAGLLGERARTLKQYGYQEGSFDPSQYDPSNPLKSYGTTTFDPTDPFSKAALLKQTYDTNRRATAQGMGSTGQLYAGSFQNRQDLINRSQLQDEDALQRSLQDFLARNTMSFGQTGVDYTTGVGQAALDAAARAASSPLYEPVTPAATPAPAPAANTVTRRSPSTGKLTRYRVGASGKLIPVGLA